MFFFRIPSNQSEFFSHDGSTNVKVDATTRFPSTILSEAFIHAVNLRVTPSSSILQHCCPVVLSRNMAVAQKTLSFRRRYHCRNETTDLCSKYTGEIVRALKVRYKTAKKQLEQNRTTFPCKMRTFDHRAYREQPD